MAETVYTCFDAPNFVDFTTEMESPSTDYFFQQGNQQGQLKPRRIAKEFETGEPIEDDGDQGERVTCPSPKKRQRMGDEDKMSPIPRRSPRLGAAAKKSPYVISKGSLSDKYKTSEELELEKIAKMRQDLAKSRKNHEVTFKKAIAKGKHVAMKSSQPPTLPQGFHFHSDQRIKGTAERTEDTSAVKDFAKTLRSALPNVDGVLKGNKCQSTTRPKPFKLTGAKSVQCLSTAEKYRSTAEQVMAYKDHFRSTTNLHRKGAPSSNTRRAQSPGLTIAKTPTLSTRGRSRSMKLLTREEEEELDFEEHKKQQFKAHPVNRKILKEAKLGVPKVPSKPLTEVKEFNLHAHASSSLSQRHSTDEDTSEFHAHAVNRKILEGPTGVKPAEKRPLTVAQSPAFHLRSRMRSRERPQPQEEVATTAAAPKVFNKPAPHMGVPFRPHLEHKCTVPEPFVVEHHSKEMLKKKEQKIQQVLEEERKAREFYASQLPSDSPDQLPAKKSQPVTVIEPFHLSVDERGEKYKEQWQSKIEEEMDKLRAKVQFHASTNKTIFKTPFVPEKSNRPLTEMSSFTLNTDQRAVKREHFNQQHKAHEAEIEAIKRQHVERKEKEESEAVAQLRQEMVHKAADVRKYKRVDPQPSDKPLTEAQSPYLRTQRLRSREMSD